MLLPMSDTAELRPPRPAYPCARPCARLRGFTLIEVLVAAFILLLMAMMVAAVVPISARGTHQSRSYTQTVLLAQRKIDQLQELTYNNVEGPTIKQGTEPIVDNGGSTTGLTPDGYRKFPFTDVEDLPKLLGPGATGEVRTRSWGGAGQGGTNGLLGVQIVVEWREGNGTVKSSYTISTVLTKMPLFN